MGKGSRMVADVMDDAIAVAEAWAERERATPDWLDPANIEAVKRSGMLAWPLAAEHGGRGCTAEETTRLVESLARVSPSMALLLAMPLGLAGLHGVGPDGAPSERQREWMDRVDAFAADVTGGAWYAACNSERGAGGSLDATKTTAARAPDGTWTISGEKILATAGAHADRFLSSAKVRAEDLPGAGIVELFAVDTTAPGVTILDDWDGFGMRPTESQSVRYESAPVRDLIGYPDFMGVMQPVTYWYLLFAAIPLGCAAAILDGLGRPAPASPALRLRFAEAQMRIEAMRAYLLESARAWRPAAGAAYGARVLRTKTYVSQEATKLCAELFALAGGRHYRRTDPLARALADAFAGTALRPPLALALDGLVEQFDLDASG